jgi:hypothetical protein
LAAAISKIKHNPETGALVEVVLASKTEAGTVLLRSVGGFVDRRELTGSGGGPIEQAFHHVVRLPEPVKDVDEWVGRYAPTSNQP